jgi:hypothetical protein
MTSSEPIRATVEIAGAAGKELSPQWALLGWDRVSLLPLYKDSLPGKVEP